MTAGQRWSTQKPTVPGWYWYKRTDGTVTVHEVVNSVDKLWINLSQYGVLDKILVSNVTAGEWLGPISPTDRQQGRVAGLREAIQRADEMGNQSSSSHVRSVVGLIVMDLREKLAQQAQGEKGVGDGNSTKV